MRTNVSRAGWPLARVVAGACAVLLSATGTAWPESGGDLLSAPAVLETPRYASPVPEDLSGLSWIEAFDALVAKMSREYALARWKDIHWPGMIDSYRPRIVAAQAAGDIGAYYLALREYVHAFHDGHVALRAFGEAPQTIIEAVERKLAGGGFGLTITKLEDGRVVSTWVKPNGPAAQAGMEPGAEILSWGGKPVDAALDQTMTVLGPSQATIGRRAREQLRYLVRAPVGVSIEVSFRNGSRGDRLRPGRSLTGRTLDLRRTVLLTSVDDDLETLIRTDARSVLRNGWPERTVEHAILPGNVGYVRIYVELDLPAEVEGDHTPTLELFRTAIAEFVDAKVAGIIVDLRGNAGGSDKMVIHTTRIRLSIG